MYANKKTGLGDQGAVVGVGVGEGAWVGARVGCGVAVG